MAFSDWLLSVTCICFLHGSSWIDSLFLFSVESYSIIWMYHSLSIYLLSLSPWAAVTKQHELGGLNNRHFFLTVLEAEKCKIKAPIQFSSWLADGLLLAVSLYVCAKSLLSCLTLCNPMDCRPPGSSVHGILQARILQWVAMPSFRASSQYRD